MAHLTQLPAEILHHILRFVDPKDLGTLALTCRFLYHYVSGNKALCRDIYCRVLDDPGSDELDWELELHDLVKLQMLCECSDIEKKKSSLGFVCMTVTRLLQHAKQGGERESRSVTYPASANAALLGALFDSDANRDTFLSRSFLFERARGHTNHFQDPPREEHQQSAKLHALYGCAQLLHGRTRSSRTYPFACSKVYDLRQHTEATGWGPFRSDGSGRVDWEKVEAALLVLRANVRNKNLETFLIFANFWSRPFAGAWPRSYLPWPADRELRGELEGRDPYNVTGTWLRVVCFLDYNDFFSYNFPVADEPPPNVPRPALDVGEATRLILMKIHVTAIEPPGEEDGQMGPVVHFRGFSRSLDGSWDENANSDLRVVDVGSVRMTREGEVRWTTFSIFSGHERWRSESIQIGGPQSARGVVGNWFDKDYDPHGPCGPTAFWKISDREPKSDDKQVALHDFLPIVDGYEDEFDDLSSEDLGNGIFVAEDLEIIHIEETEDDDYEE